MEFADVVLWNPVKFVARASWRANWRSFDISRRERVELERNRQNSCLVDSVTGHRNRNRDNHHEYFVPIVREFQSAHGQR